jgi:hypothetical protein
MGRAVGELADDVEREVSKPDREIYDSFIAGFIGESGAYLFQKSFRRPVHKRLILDESTKGEGIADGTSDFRVPISIRGGKQIWDHNTLADTGGDGVLFRLHRPKDFLS